jgi:hypothetical protein
MRCGLMVEQGCSDVHVQLSYEKRCDRMVQANQIISKTIAFAHVIYRKTNNTSIIILRVSEKSFYNI